MSAPYTGPRPGVNHLELRHNNIAPGSVISVVRPWREDETPDASNFPVARVLGVSRTANGFAVYETTAGRVWFDRVSAVISSPAVARAAA
jgi:hypothetical protein